MKSPGWSDEARRSAQASRRLKRKPSASPPSLLMVEPPWPKGKLKDDRKAGGISAVDGLTNTEIGDLGERAARNLGLRTALDGRRQGDFDALWGDDWVVEIKTRTTYSSQYKVGMKKSEIEKKLRSAEELGLNPMTALLILDTDASEAWVYWRKGIANGELKPSRLEEWSFMGYTKA